MGLFDSFSLDNLFSDDPKRQATLAMAMGLLGGSGKTRRNFGADLENAGLLGMNTYGNAQKMERENRASDLAQLGGAYNLLKQQEFGKMLAAKQAGQPYAPNPMLPQMETKLAQLTGLGNLSGKFGLTAPPAQGPQTPAAPTLPAAQASQYSPVVNPDYQARGPMPQPQAQQDSSGLGGPAGGIPMEAWLAQDPTGGSYMRQLAEDNKPITLRQGDLVQKKGDRYVSAYQQPVLDKGIVPQRDNNGQVISASAIPGYAPAVAGIKGAETGATESAKFPYRVEMVKRADGAVVPTLVSTVVGNPSNSFLTGANSPIQGQAARAPAAPPQNVAANQDGFWADMPKRPAPQGVGQSTYDEGLQGLMAKQADRLAEKYGTNSDLAQSRIALNNQSKALLDRADTGPGALLIGDVKNALVSRFGMKESDFSNDPAATAVLGKNLQNAAIAKAKAAYGVRMSTNEVNNMLKRGAANSDMIKSAINFMLDVDNAQAQYALEQANHFGEYLDRGGNPMRFEAWYAKKNPLTAKEEAIGLPVKSGVTTLRFDSRGQLIQ